MGFCSDLHLYSWILGNDWKTIIPSANGRDEIFAKSPWRDTWRQMRSCEIRKTLNVDPLLRIEISQWRWFDHVTRMPHKRLARHVQLAISTGKRPRGRPRTRWRDYISDLTWPVLVWSQQYYQRLLLTHADISSPSRAAALRLFPEEKRKRKWMIERVITQTWTLFALQLAVVCCCRSKIVSVVHRWWHNLPKS